MDDMLSIKEMPETSDGILPVVNVPERSPEEVKEEAEIFEFNQAKPYLSELERGFGEELTRAIANRERRKVDIDIEKERKEKRIKESDTFIPMRVIDENISREKPAFIAYLQNSRRLAIFSDRRNPQTKHDDLEGAFTRGMQYNNWIINHHKTIDGSQLHGWDWYEVLYDAEKPLHCGIEHVGHDRLEFCLDAEDIQNNMRIARVYKWTRAQLDSAVRNYGFNKDQVDKLKCFQKNNSPSSGTVKDQVYTVKKGYCKYNGVVYNYWYSLDACDDWLSAPTKFYNGVDQQVSVEIPMPPTVMSDPITGAMMTVPQPPQISQEWQPVDEILYPVRLLPYEETEQKEISTRKGRAFKDKFKQEAMTAGVTSYLNALQRSSWFIACKAENDGRSTTELQSFEMKDGAIAPWKFDQLAVPAPDPQTLQALQFLDTKNAQSIGQMTYATQNKSSGARTTAKEIESAQQDTALLSSVNVTLFSAAIRDVYTAAWRIVQSQALQDKIEFFGSVRSIPSDPMNPMSDPIEQFENNHEVIKRDYDIRPAGDTDVIQRQEMIAQMKEYWEIVSGTPVASEFLGELLKLQFGEKGESWAKMLQAGDPKVLLAEYYKIITVIIANPQELATLGPQEMQSIQMLLQQTEQILNTNTQGAQNPNGSNNTQQRGNTTGQSGQGGMAQGQGDASGNSQTAQAA